MAITGGHNWGKFPAYLFAVLLPVAIAACGGSRDAGMNQPAADPALGVPPDSELFPPPAVDTPSLEDLQAMLDSELVRLGKDERTTSQAPLGNENAVFDLKVSFYDLQQGAVLSWTERHVGDYDMNGLVNASDLTPLAQRWKYTIDYLPETESGVPWWPDGNPRDGGLSGVINGKPGFNTPADQWRTARVDGDGNGEINLADVTPIALHWQQNLDSWRVYRRAPGEEGFTLLQPEPGLGYSLPRSAQFPQGQGGPDNNWVYRMLFPDLDVGPGNYHYYVAPFDSTTGTEGATSPVVQIEFPVVNEPPPPPPGNEPPEVVLNADTAIGNVPTTVNFDATGSFDPEGQITLYLWDWEGDGVADFSSSNAPQASHEYTRYGRYKPRLTVWDDNGASASAQLEVYITLFVNGREPADIDLQADVVEGRRPLQVHFTAEMDLKGNNQNDYIFEWDLNGDGERDSKNKPLPDGVHYTYEHAGSYTARLSAGDGYGLYSESYLAIKVLPNTDPLAVIESDVTGGGVPLTVNFSAAGSSDPDGDALSYAWDMDGDGEFELDTGSDPTALHEFVFIGEYQPAVRVTDEYGAVAVNSLAISVSTPVNQDPVAFISADPPTWSAPKTVTFSGEGSYDPDTGSGVNLVYSFDFDNDGIFDQSSINKEASWYFEQPGTYPVKLVVEDYQGGAGEAAYQLVLTENSPPDIVMTASVTEGSFPLQVDFDCSQSTDPEGDDFQLEWDFDYYSPGNFVEGGLTGSHVYETGGYHRCRVRATDYWGQSSEEEIEISCTGSGWYLSFVDDAKVPYQGESVDLEVINGKPAICYGQRGGNPLTASVRYCSAIDVHGLRWRSPRMVSDLGEGVGSAVSLIDDNGLARISWQDAYDGIFTCRALDPQGLAWGSIRQFLDYFLEYPQGTSLSIVNGNPALAFVTDAEQLAFVRANDSNGVSWADHIQLGTISKNFVDNHQMRLLSLGGLPCLGFIGDSGSSSTVLWRKASDANGASWQNSKVVGQAASGVRGLGMVIIDGNPLLAYYSDVGLVCQISLDDGETWELPAVVTDVLAESGSRPSEVCMIDYGGVPALLDQYMQLWVAGDTYGVGWSGPEAIPTVEPADAFDLCIVDGNPAVAFQQDKLFFAIKLP